LAIIIDSFIEVFSLVQKVKATEKTISKFAKVWVCTVGLESDNFSQAEDGVVQILFSVEAIEGDREGRSGIREDGGTSRVARRDSADGLPMMFYSIFQVGFVAPIAESEDKTIGDIAEATRIRRLENESHSIILDGVV
jgi:hypothetical protein